MIFEMKTVNAAIFDMDGTMFDTERLRFKMIKQASTIVYGEPICDEILIGSLGLSAKAGEEIAKKYYGDDYPYNDIRKKADELEVKYIRQNGVPVKIGLIDVLTRLKKNGVLLAVATSSKRAITEEYLLSASIMRYFDIIVCGDEVEKGKPNPEIFLKAAGELNCKPSNCLIFEDSENGLRAAIDSMGMPIFIRDLKEPRKDIKSRVFKAYDTMIDFLDDLIKYTIKMKMPKVNEPFPQIFNHMTVGIHGFGAIGGGYLTQIFSHWDGYTRPKKIIGATNNNTLNKLINSFGKFNVYYESLAFPQTISNVNIINLSNEDEMKNMYAESEIIGLSIPESSIKQQSKIIAKCLIERDKINGKNLTILIVLNKIGAGLFVKKNVERALINLAGKEESDKIINKTSFCETVVNRMVSKIPEKMILQQLEIKFNNFNNNLKKKDIDINNFSESNEKATSVEDKIKEVDSIFEKLSDISQVTQEITNLYINLFNSEPDMPIYAQKGSPIIKNLRQIKIVDDINKMQNIKNKLSNGTHAIIAWYSSLLGYKTIGQGIGDEKVLNFVNNVMKTEIKPAILSDDPMLEEYIDCFIDSFIKRYRYSFKDSCIRVSRDPLRKLQKGERIFGTIDLSQKHNVKTPLLEFGVAIGLLYSISLINPKDKDSQLIKNIYDKEKSIKDILTYKGEYNGKPYSSLNEYEDIELINRIEKIFNNLLEKSTAFHVNIN